METLKELAFMVDKYADTRQRRLDLEKAVEELRAEEAAMKDTLLEALTTTGAGSIGGKRFRVTHRLRAVGHVKDWDAFYAYIKRTGEFDLLQRRVASTAMAARWADGCEVDGVECITLDDLSVPTKL
jgi:hypothetical protein